jgi:hypothetical protein
MILTQLLNILRAEFLDDVVEPYLWSDPELVFDIREAQDEATRRAHLIIEEHNPAVCQIPIQVGVSWYPLHDKVLLVKRAKFGTSFQHSYPLRQTTRSRMDQEHPGWSGRHGQVGAYIIENEGEIMFVGASIEAGTAFLQVSRLPLNELTLNSNLTGTAGYGITYPEIPERYHRKMLYWAAHLAFLKNDSETFNLQKSELYEKKFEQHFGKAVSAKTERFMRSNNLDSARMRSRPFGS